VSFDAFAAAIHVRASASSRIFLRSIGHLHAASLHGRNAAIIPVSLMGHGARERLAVNTHISKREQGP
jgi:hypothetical protein